MNNLDWLCENDREQLMKLLAEGDSCEYCALEIEDDCGVRCNEGVRAWLEAEHNDGLKPENGVSDPDGGSNVAYIAQDTREKLESDVLGHVEDIRNKNGFTGVCADYGTVIGWLDRQAAITERECAERIRQLEDERRIADELRKQFGGFERVIIDVDGEQHEFRADSLIQMLEDYEDAQGTNNHMKLFGTPEKAARTLADLQTCSLGFDLECDECAVYSLCRSGARNDRDALLEWLRGESE